MHWYTVWREVHDVLQDCLDEFTTLHEHLQSIGDWQAPQSASAAGAAAAAAAAAAVTVPSLPAS